MPLVSCSAAVAGPTQPTIGNAVAAGSSSIGLEFSSSTATDTLFPITGYDASCTDGQNTFTGFNPTPPVPVSGLTNGTAYTCTVTATSLVGTSAASTATATIVPEESATGLPIWLLYKATK